MAMGMRSTATRKDEGESFEGQWRGVKVKMLQGMLKDVVETLKGYGEALMGDEERLNDSLIIGRGVKGRQRIVKW